MNSPPVPSLKKTPISAPAILLIGGAGSGKTHSLTTLIEAGLDLFVFVTEPNGIETLIDVVQRKGLPLSKLHWMSVSPTRAGFDQLQTLADTIARGTFETLSKLPPSPKRNEAQVMKFLKGISNFIDDPTGEEYGSIEKFDETRVVVIDSLSGLNLMAMDLVIGDKPNAHPGEWGVAMGFLEKLLNKLTGDLSCPFVLTAHIEREQDEITGGTKIMTSTLGRKLAPKLPRFFSEVVLAHRDGPNYFWSTSALSTDLKNRSLPLGDKLSPTFAPIIAAYQARLKATRGVITD